MRRQQVSRPTGSTTPQPIALIVVLLLLTPVYATTIVVDETTCTLVDAITAANTDTDTGGCPAGFDADTIRLTADVTLTTVDNSQEGDDIGLPVIASAITVVGSDFTIERDASAPPFILFWVASDGRLSLNDVTLRNGARAITNLGILDMVRVNVSANLGHGIFVLPGGTAHLIDCIVSDNLLDGIIFNSATVYVTESTVTGNGFFGILGVYGAVNVTRSNISHNSFTGLRLDYSEGLLTNSTVSGNLGFGVNIYLSSVDILHSTLSGNERGIYASLDPSVSVRLSNSIIANNEPGYNCSTFPGLALTDLGSNFADDHTCGTGFTNIIPGVDYDVVLADNGGPTQTHALLPGSVAIDAGSDECPPTDQRGVDRPLDGDGDGISRCDAGPFEYEIPLITVSIDIKPDSYPNSINPYSRGVIPVAILGGEDLDMADIDETTLSLGPGGARLAHRHAHFGDVNLDGIMDLMLHFRTQDTGIACGDESATLTGETVDGQPFEGTDSIQTVGCRVTRRPAIWMKDQDEPDSDRRDGPVDLQRKW